MAEDVARAVGAGSPDDLTIAGRVCKIRPVSLKELGELERDCLSQYRRSFVQAFVDTADFLPEKTRERLIQSKVEEAAKFGLGDLPRKFVYDTRKLQPNPKVEAWMEDHYGVRFEEVEEEKKVKFIQRVLASALDGEEISENDYKELTGLEPRKQRVGYVNWWVTGCYDGMLAIIHKCFRDAGVTKQQISDELATNPTLMMNIAREIEHLSVPAVGNG